MKTFVVFISLAIIALAYVMAMQGCERPVCPGYERIDYGSGCRKVGSPDFVERSLCEECGA